MDTIYDWLSLAIFAGLIVLFLQRSTSERADNDVSLLYYLGAGVGCAVANYFGNKGQDVVAILLLLATVGFIGYFLKPFQRPSSS
jgi:ABC-type Mn2+/Zn2+ transport system permease subunit